MRVKQQNTALTKINPHLIYAVNTIVLFYIQPNYYISVPEGYS